MPDYPLILCGIDPGQSGGIAMLGQEFVEAFPMPDTEDDICAILREFPIQCAFLEAVTPMPKQGLGSTWKFGQHYGMLRGMLAALKIRREFVRPQVWQKALGIPKRGGKTQTEHKNVLKQRAQEVYPQLHITHATADALLIARYGLTVHPK